MIRRLSEEIDRLHLLNAPDTDAEYYLSHLSGYNLSTADGLVFAAPDSTDASQRFMLIPVEGVANTYNIYTNGLYVSVIDDALAFTETPRDEWGQFVATQVSSSSFTLHGALGYLGASDGDVSAGQPCVGNAEYRGENIRWTLVKATQPIIESGITPHSYMDNIDYAVAYDKESQTLRFVSDDMAVLAKVSVQVYTVGGRLLYTFKASDRQSLVELPSGTYIVRWTLGAAVREVKLKK
ncbi:MAG: T9SS type A sorting domain-containing protein [Bacteroidaceae bacterium]|nr:T9SS type A sorting domain-containing protein [Bacteroidaceae bacterium]